MAKLIVDQSLTNVLNRDVTEHIRQQIAQLFRTAPVGFVSEIRLRPFPDVQNVTAIEVAVTVGNVLVSGFAGTLTYAAPISITSLDTDALVNHIVQIIWDSWNVTVTLLHRPSNLAAKKVLDLKLKELDVSNVAPGEPPLKLQLDESDPPFEMSGEPPTCPLCGHIAVNRNGFWKCLNCGESLGRVDGKKDDDLSVPAATIPCPECGKTMEHVGTFQKCPACRYSTGPS